MFEILSCLNKILPAEARLSDFIIIIIIIIIIVKNDKAIPVTGREGP
jgi:hypothetical protein